MRAATSILLSVGLIPGLPPCASAHDGPPFPIVSDRTVGAYTISVWTDPDTTDDGSAGGQFWIVIDRAGAAAQTDEGMDVRVTAALQEEPGTIVTAPAAPVRGNPSTHFAALMLDREARYTVTVTVDGPLGRATLDAAVDATYDLRPPPMMLALYLVPFLVVGLLWGRLLIKRRSARAGASG